MVVPHTFTHILSQLSYITEYNWMLVTII